MANSDVNISGNAHRRPYTGSEIFWKLFLTLRISPGALRLCLNFAWPINTIRLLGIHGLLFVQQISAEFTKDSY